MKKCDNCDHRFRWAETFKAWSFGNSLVCPSCNAEYRITGLSKAITAILTVLPLIVFQLGIENRMKLNSVLQWGLYILYLILIFLFSPFFLKYKMQAHKDNN